jgi:hypothetical protein
VAEPPRRGSGCSPSWRDRAEVTRDFQFPGVTFTGGHGILFRADPAGASRHGDAMVEGDL